MTFTDYVTTNKNIWVKCGNLKRGFSTRDHKMFMFTTNAGEADVEQAWLILQELLCDEDLLCVGCGRFNKDSVNLAIALHVLGVDDVTDWMEKFIDVTELDHPFLILEKFDIIQPYLKTWGPLGNRGMALDKLVE